MPAVVFDFDDTIIITRKTKINRLYRAAKSMNFRPPSEQEIYEHWNSPNLRTLLKRIWHNLSPENLDDLERVYSEISTSYPTFPGAIKTLEFARATADCVGMQTSRDRNRLSDHLVSSGLDLAEYFHFISTSDDVSHQKPNPRSMKKVLDELDRRGIFPEKRYYIGDDIRDGKAAGGAGLNFVGVLTGYTTEEEFRAEGFHDLVASIAEIPIFLESRLK